MPPRCIQLPAMTTRDQETILRLPADLSEELEFIAMEATRGQPLGPSLARSVERDITALFRSRGAPHVIVRAHIQGGGLAVEILFPRPGQRVERVVVHLGTQ